MNDQDPKWEVPIKWRFDETNPEFEELARRSTAEQAKWAKRANSPFGNQSASEFERGRAVRRIEAKKEALATLTIDDPMYVNIAAQLSEAYATVGRFDLAAQTDTRKKYQVEYERVWLAVTRNESEWCEHGQPSGPTQKGVSSTKLWEGTVWSIKLGREVPLLKCCECGLTCAGPLPADLADLEARRQAHRESLRGLTPEQAMQREREMLSQR